MLSFKMKPMRTVVSQQNGSAHKINFLRHREYLHQNNFAKKDTNTMATKEKPHINIVIIGHVDSGETE